MKTLKRIAAIVLMGLILSSCSSDKDWRTASRESAAIAPDPALTHEAVLHVYGADAWSWRGWFAIHTWIAAKRTGETVYTVYDVVGWRGYHGQPVLRIFQDLPDRYWYGAKPRILQKHRGPGVDELIDAVDRRPALTPGNQPTRPSPDPTAIPSPPGSPSKCPNWTWTSPFQPSAAVMWPRFEERRNG